MWLKNGGVQASSSYFIVIKCVSFVTKSALMRESLILLHVNYKGAIHLAHSIQKLNSIKNSVLQLVCVAEKTECFLVEKTEYRYSLNKVQMGLDSTKPVLAVSDKARLKSVYAATQTS